MLCRVLVYASLAAAIGPDPHLIDPRPHGDAPSPVWADSYSLEWRPAAPNLTALPTLRDDRAQACAQACENRTLYLKHLRKAGGTSLRLMFGEFVCRARRELAERALVNEARPFDVAMLGARASAPVFVTCMREPIARILSSYWFEGRTPLLAKGASLRQKGAPTVPVPAAKGGGPMTLDQWIDRTQSPWEVNKAKRQKRLWIVVQNYYVQVFGGKVTGGPVDDELYARAVQVLNSFDVVLILEWMGDPEHCALLARLGYGDPGRVHANSCSPLSSRGRAARPVARGDADGAPDTAVSALGEGVTNASLARLGAMNKRDAALYAYAKNLTRFRIARAREEEPERVAAGSGEGAAAPGTAALGAAHDAAEDAPANGGRRASAATEACTCPRLEEALEPTLDGEKLGRNCAKFHGKSTSWMSHCHSAHLGAIARDAPSAKAAPRPGPESAKRANQKTARGRYRNTNGAKL